jgi:hypothetical protein
MNARYYDPVLGPSLSPDTLVPEPGKPGAYIRYAYTQKESRHRLMPSINH